MTYEEVVVDGLGEINIDLEGEYLDQEWRDLPLSPQMILDELILVGMEWPLARIRFNYLVHEPDGEWVWNLINDGCYLVEIQNLIRDKTNESWVDLYRRTYAHLEEIAYRYLHDEPYCYYDHHFNLLLIARELANDLLMEQTAPFNEARSLEIDEYLGIDDEGDREYIRVPDYARLPDRDGNLVDVSLMNLKPDLSWSEPLDDPDHEWYEDYRKDDHPSATIQQMKEQEYQITDQFYDLMYRYGPAIKELERQIKEDKLYKIANKENRLFVYEFLANRLKNSILVKSIEKALRQASRIYPIQDVAALVMNFPVELEINGNVSIVIDIFGDDILDSIVDGKGMQDRAEMDWLDELNAFHAMTLDKLDALADNNSVRTSAEFVRETINSIAVGGLDIREANTRAYKSWREHVSPTGSNAFRQSIDHGDDLSTAMKAFYKAAKDSGEFVSRDRVVGATDDKLILKTSISSYTNIREVSWGIAKLKARNNELYIPKTAPKASVDWLISKFKSLGISDHEITQLNQ